MDENNQDWKKPSPKIKKKIITCDAAECGKNLHLFKTNMRKKSSKLENKTYRNVVCVSCNKDIVDWDRIDKKDPNDTDYLFKQLRLEKVRHDFWKIKIKKHELVKAEKKGLKILRQDIEKRLEQYLVPPSHKIYRDGTQTPKSGNIIYYGQYFTGTCCRKCLEEWHNIKRGKQMTKKELGFCRDIILKYIMKKAPTITEDGKTT